jgi:hypothetical protein
LGTIPYQYEWFVGRKSFETPGNPPEAVMILIWQVQLDEAWKIKCCPPGFKQRRWARQVEELARDKKEHRHGETCRERC